MKTPEESEEAKEARKRERRMSLAEQRETTQDTAYGLTSDLQGVYGLGPATGTGGTVKAAKKKKSLFSDALAHLGDAHLGVGTSGR